ncbi:MAG: hypothetical protein LBP56_04390 [Odoribacteraceae bacterium]|nr:hypothetical protein [Odoribacteraceae bacterium]
MKTVTLVLSAMLAFTLNATAQQGGQRMSPEEMLKRRVETVKKELKLTGEQEKQVTTLFRETQKKQAELFQNGGGRENREANREKFQKLQEEENAGMKKILTEEQFKSYTAFLEKQRKEREERMRSRGQGQGQRTGGGPR